MAVSTKLAELDIRETSGVDHPAHLHEGWLVIKSAADSDAATDEGDNPEMELDVTEETVVEEAVAEEPTPVAASVAGPDEELRKELTDLRKELAGMRAEKERIEAEAELAKAVENDTWQNTETWAAHMEFVDRQRDWIFDTEGALCQANDGECTG